ncbi:cupin domain-containing protein [Rhizobium ruizarguesonis]
MDGVTDAVRLEQGDCFVLPRRFPFRLASDLNLPSVAASTIFPPARAGGMVTVNGGAVFPCGRGFRRWRQSRRQAAGMLPPIMHLHLEAERNALRWSIERMIQEVRSHQPGGCLMAQISCAYAAVSSGSAHSSGQRSPGHGMVLLLG